MRLLKSELTLQISDLVALGDGDDALRGRSGHAAGDASQQNQSLRKNWKVENFK